MSYAERAKSNLHLVSPVSPTQMLYPALKLRQCQETLEGITERCSNMFATLESENSLELNALYCVSHRNCFGIQLNGSGQRCDNPRRYDSEMGRYSRWCGQDHLKEPCRGYCLLYKRTCDEAIPCNPNIDDKPSRTQYEARQIEHKNCANYRTTFTQQCVHITARDPGHQTAIDISQDRAQECENFAKQFGGTLKRNRSTRRMKPYRMKNSRTRSNTRSKTRTRTRSNTRSRSRTRRKSKRRTRNQVCITSCF